MAAAGMNIQNHQMLPAGAQVLTANAMKMKATPVKNLSTARSIVGGLFLPRRRRRPPRESSSSLFRRSASWPVTACGTRLMSVPHARQNLASSAFCAAHLGQNIAEPSKLNDE